MESLYSKLYDKYTNLKTKKFSEMDEVNKDQEIKFVNYVSAAEELIDHLRSENDRLHSKVDDLRSEVASIRSTTYEKCTDYQKLLMEENRKNIELSEEVERLRKLQEVGNCSRSKVGKTDNGGTPASGEVSREAGIRRSARIKTRKQRWHSQSKTGDIVTPSSSSQDAIILIEPEKDLHKESMSSGALITFQQLQCCRVIEGPGDSVNTTGEANCVFQVIFGHLVGLKLSTVNQSEEICISAVHESSGYSFNLRWVKSGGGKEAELVYDVISLGSLERVAPEWMKESIMFTTTMLPKFFKRLSCVVNLQS